MYEIELKSHLIFFLQDFLKIKNISFEQFLNMLELYNLIAQKKEPISDYFKSKLIEEFNKHTKDFSTGTLNYSEYYYILIKILSFGTIGKLLEHMYEGELVFTLFSNYLKRYNKFSIGKQLKNLRTIITLRNSLCHKESLVLFLEKGVKKNRKESLKRRKGSLKDKTLNDYLELRIKAISDIYEYHYKKLKIKKKLSENSWIKSYRSLRLNNGENGNNFKKLKIDV